MSARAKHALLRKEEKPQNRAKTDWDNPAPQEQDHYTNCLSRDASTSFQMYTCRCIHDIKQKKSHKLLLLLPRAAACRLQETCSLPSRARPCPALVRGGREPCASTEGCPGRAPAASECCKKEGGRTIGRWSVLDGRILHIFNEHIIYAHVWGKNEHVNVRVLYAC